MEPRSFILAQLFCFAAWANWHVVFDQEPPKGHMYVLYRHSDGTLYAYDVTDECQETVLDTIDDILTEDSDHLFIGKELDGQKC